MPTHLANLDRRLAGLADAAAQRLGATGAVGEGPLRGFVAAEGLSLVALAWAVCSLGGWVPVLLAATVVVARGPGLQRAWPRGRRGPAAARAARASDASARHGALGLLGAFALIAAAAALAGYASEAAWPGADDGATFGIDASALSAWKVLALPASTAVEIARRYAECALPDRRTGLSA